MKELLCYVPILTKVVHCFFTYAVKCHSGESCRAKCPAHNHAHIIPAGARTVLSSSASRPALGSTQFPTEWDPRVLTTERKRLSREVDR